MDGEAWQVELRDGLGTFRGAARLLGALGPRDDDALEDHPDAPPGDCGIPLPR